MLTCSKQQKLGRTGLGTRLGCSWNWECTGCTSFIATFLFTDDIPKSYDASLDFDTVPTINLNSSESEEEDDWDDEVSHTVDT